MLSHRRREENRDRDRDRDGDDVLALDGLNAAPQGSTQVTYDIVTVQYSNSSVQLSLLLYCGLLLDFRSHLLTIT